MLVSARYRDRETAGRVLAQILLEKRFTEPPLILAIPNGGLAVAQPIALALKGDLDLLIVRKLQIPYNPEAGFGALTSLGTVILNEPLVARIRISQNEIQRVINQTKEQIERRKKAYSGLVGSYSPKNRLVILVDDGLASGYTMLAAIESVRKLAPQKILVAVPTASASAISRVREVVDDLVCPNVGSGYVFAVADAYLNWYDVSDKEVISLLKKVR